MYLFHTTFEAVFCKQLTSASDASRMLCIPDSSGFLWSSGENVHRFGAYLSTDFLVHRAPSLM